MLATCPGKGRAILHCLARICLDLPGFAWIHPVTRSRPPHAECHPAAPTFVPRCLCVKPLTPIWSDLPGFAWIHPVTRSHPPYAECHPAVPTFVPWCLCVKRITPIWLDKPGFAWINPDRIDHRSQKSAFKPPFINLCVFASLRFFHCGHCWMYLDSAIFCHLDSPADLIHSCLPAFLINRLRFFGRERPRSPQIRPVDLRSL